MNDQENCWDAYILDIATFLKSSGNTRSRPEDLDKECHLSCNGAQFRDEHIDLSLH